MENLLCVNSAESQLQVALYNNDSLMVGLEATSNKRGMVLLPKMIKKCLEIEDISIKDIHKLAVVVGPGSFTGIRISISILTGISFGGNIPIGGINYLELLAQNAFFHIKINTLFVITYAKINLVYVQGFEGPSPILPITDPMVCKIDDIYHIIPQNKETYVLGSGVRKYPHIFNKKYTKILSPSFNKPSFDALFNCSQKINFSHTPPTPLYLRPSDAEENFEKIAKQRGLL